MPFVMSNLIISGRNVSQALMTRSCVGRAAAWGLCSPRGWILEPSPPHPGSITFGIIKDGRSKEDVKARMGLAWGLWSRRQLRSMAIPP
ncbi:hypothetical protein CapIbe_011603 [Capra ibex]